MKKSFTLVELIVVIAIIAILSAIIAPNAFKAIEKAKISRAIAEFKSMKTATLSFYSDTGSWPLSAGGWVRVEASGLMSNTNNWPGWDGPYLENNVSTHPWGGIYWLEVFNLGGNAQPDFTVEMNDICYGGSPRGKCGLPQTSAQRIDNSVDDGDLSNGAFRRWSGYGDTFWAIQWDIF